MEERVHPTPFRTRQLSSPSPMILRTSCGKVGRRQSFFKGSVQLKRSEPFSFPLLFLLLALAPYPPPSSPLRVSISPVFVYASLPDYVSAATSS